MFPSYPHLCHSQKHLTDIYQAEEFWAVFGDFYCNTEFLFDYANVFIQAFNTVSLRLIDFVFQSEIETADFDKLLSKLEQVITSSS